MRAERVRLLGASDVFGAAQIVWKMRLSAVIVPLQSVPVRDRKTQDSPRSWRRYPPLEPVAGGQNTCCGPHIPAPADWTWADALDGHPGLRRVSASICKRFGEGSGAGRTAPALRYPNPSASLVGVGKPDIGVLRRFFCHCNRTDRHFLDCAVPTCQTQTHWLTVARQTRSPISTPRAFSCSSTPRRAHRVYRCPAHGQSIGGCLHLRGLAAWSKDLIQRPQWIATWGNTPWVGEKDC